MEDETDTDPPIPEAERELLLAALERGYFEVPRQVTVCDLAEEFDISDREAAERLVRGMSAVLQRYRDDLDEGTGPPIDEQSVRAVASQLSRLR